MNFLIFNVSTAIDIVEVAGYTQRLNKKTGSIDDQYVYSITFDRTGFDRLNMNAIDPIKAVENFEHLIDLTARFELKTIDKDI